MLLAKQLEEGKMYTCKLSNRKVLIIRKEINPYIEDSSTLEDDTITYDERVVGIYYNKATGLIEQMDIFNYQLQLC